MNFPAGKPNFESIDPFGDAGLAGIDLLTSAHKANDRAPILMPIHYANEELWLGHIEVGLSSFALHEASRLFARPSALSLVKHNNFLKRNSVIANIVISEVMDILDKTANLALSRRFRDPFPRGLVTCKGLSKDINKRPIAG
jgi:hypothetical protein